MAVKYWYKASNGSDNWSVVGNWYLGPGGTGGAAGLPTTADDVILDAASGTGTLTIAATATCNSLNASAFLGTLAGASALNIVTSSVASNNSNVLLLGVNHTYSGLITFTTSIGNTLNINCNDVFHKGNMTFNTVTGNWRGYNTSTSSYVPIRLTGLFTLTSGTIGNSANQYETSNDIYAGTMASSSSQVRAFYINNVYLSGTGTLLTTNTQTNINFNVFAFYLTNTSATAKSISFSADVFTQNIYLQGSGASATTITSNANAQVYPAVYVSKTDGTLIIGTSRFSSLTFIEGSTIAWASTSTVVLTLEGNLTLCNSVILTSSNALTFAGGATFTTFDKTFTGILTFNDTVGGSTVTINGDYISTASGNAISATFINTFTFNNSVQLTNGAISINASGMGNAMIANFNSVSSPTTISITNAYVTLGNTTLSGTLTFNSGILTFRQNSVSSIFAIASSNVNTRFIVLNNATITLTGNTGTIWNTGTSTGLGLNAGTSTINITSTANATLTFAGGGLTYYNLYINRSTGANVPSMITAFTGNNTFQNFIDYTILTALSNFITIQFGGGSTTTINDTFQIGNSINSTASTILQSSSGVTYFNIVKSSGLVICNNISITRSNASNPNIFYAINSSDGGTTGWIFGNPPRRQGSLGVG